MGHGCEVASPECLEGTDAVLIKLVEDTLVVGLFVGGRADGGLYVEVGGQEHDRQDAPPIRQVGKVMGVYSFGLVGVRWLMAGTHLRGS